MVFLKNEDMLTVNRQGHFLKLANPDFQINDDDLALFHLGPWRGLLPRQEILAVNMLGRSAQLVHELLVVDQPRLEEEKTGCHLGLGEQSAATLACDARNQHNAHSGTVDVCTQKLTLAH